MRVFATIAMIAGMVMLLAGIWSSTGVERAIYASAMALFICIDGVAGAIKERR